MDAELLLADCLNKTRTWLMTWPDYVLTNKERECFQAAILQRKQGTPIAYLLGYRDFWTLRLNITDAVLIPRPETELLVETALAHIPLEQAVSVLDLGTGSGAIALAIAQERPQADITATDYSAAALAIAQENIQAYALEQQIQCIYSDWFAALDKDKTYDLIVSNPPYIEANDPHLQQGDLRFEPQTALSSGADGLEAIRKLIAQAPHWLKPKGWLMIEHGYEQQNAIIDLLQARGFSAVQGVQDLSGLDRLVLGQWLTSCTAITEGNT